MCTGCEHMRVTVTDKWTMRTAVRQRRGVGQWKRASGLRGRGPRAADVCTNAQAHAQGRKVRRACEARRARAHAQGCGARQTPQGSLEGHCARAGTRGPPRGSNAHAQGHRAWEMLRGNHLSSMRWESTGAGVHRLRVWSQGWKDTRAAGTSSRGLGDDVVTSALWEVSGLWMEGPSLRCHGWFAGGLWAWALLSLV